MNKEKFLPIGTVCKLKEGQKNLMIIGFCQSSSERQNEIYDYSGCLYPEGVYSSELNFLFNHDQIDEIVFMGLINSEEIDFKNRLKEFLTTGKIDGKEIKTDETSNVISLSSDMQQANRDLEELKMQNQNEISPSIVDQSLNNPSPSVEIGSMPTFDTLNLNQQNNN